MTSCHVITLARRQDRRREFLRRNAGKADFVFVDAVDGQDLDPEAIEREGLLAPRAAGITAGALGCALSHRRLWQRCTAAGETMIILEDDCCLRPDFMAQTAEALAAAPSCDIVHFGYNLDRPLALYLAKDLMAMVTAGAKAMAADGWLDGFAATAAFSPPRVAVVRPALLWGLLAYAVTPAGASRLLSACFPLRNHELSLPQGPARSRGLDGSILALVQAGAVRAACCFPPIAVGPNDDSDTEGIAVKKRGAPAKE